MRLKTFLSSALAVSGLSLAGAPPAAAENGVRLAELYVSQSCGNCPKAMDVLAREAAHHPTVLVLTWSVDYWNYLGWTDTFAREEYSARQARYADKLGARGPYTPMLVINGSSQIKGNKKSLVCKAFEALEASVAPATAQPSDGVEIRAELVEFKPGETRFQPGNGPNRGEEMVYTNLVLSTQDVTLDSDPFAKCPSTCALVISDASSGTIVQLSTNR